MKNRNLKLCALALSVILCISGLTACGRQSSDVGSAGGSKNTSKSENASSKLANQPATEKEFIELLKDYSDDLNSSYTDLYDHLSGIQASGSKVSQEDLAVFATNTRNGLDAALNVETLCLSSSDFKISKRSLEYSVEAIKGYQEFLKLLANMENDFNAGLERIKYSNQGLMRCASGSEDLTKDAILWSSNSAEKNAKSTNNTNSTTNNNQNEPTSSENSSTSTSIFDFTASDIEFGEQDIHGLRTKFGQLLSVIYNDGTVVVKTKITPNLTNIMTINQNYYIVEDLVKNYGFNTCNELQYWAVADMTDGEESKCISFTLYKETINSLYNGSIVANQLGSYVADLWILPSLLE